MSRNPEATVTFPAPDCLKCGSPVMAARNPFYGVGLATHKYVRNCVDCPWYDFAGDAGAVSVEADPRRKRIQVVQQFWSKVNAAVTGLKAA